MHNPVHVQLFVNSSRGHLSIIKPDRNRGRNPVFDQNLGVRRGRNLYVSFVNIFCQISPLDAVFREPYRLMCKS